MGVNYCSSCGTALLSSSPATTMSVQPVENPSEADDDAGANGFELPRGVAMLVVRRGPNSGARFVLDEGTTRAGRHPDSDIFFDDVTVSRRHAEFVTEEGRTTVRDVGSLNGTYVNRERIEESRLASGDEVQIGKFKLLFLVATGE